MAVNRMFRTCPTTGLVYHQAAEKLMRWNAVAGVVALLFGGILALLVVLTRWQAVHLLPPDWFYLVLTAHGLNMLVFWIIFFEIAVLYFAASVLLKCRLAAPRWAWAAFWLMVVGALTNNVAVLRGDGRAPGVLPRADPVRGGRADRAVRLLRHARRRQERADVQRLHPGRHIWRGHRGDHRRVYVRVGRDHPDPDVPVVARSRQLHRLADVSDGLVGVRPQLDRKSTRLN